MMKYVWLGIALMSLILFVVMSADKSAARRGARRVPEKSLFLLALIGGAAGGTLGMFAFHHKTKHWYFRIGFPLIAVLQLAACVYFGYIA